MLSIKIQSFAIVTGIVCAFDLVAIAGLDITYVPPPGREILQRTEGSGSRGCNRPLAASYALLAPKDHVGTTTKSHPTFMWQVNTRSPVLMRFALIQENTAKKTLMDVRMKVNQAGIVKIGLSSKAPPLELNKIYRWTVSEICNERRLSKNSFASAFITRIPVPQQLEGHQKAALYAQAGIWYDAVFMAYVDYQQKRPEIFANLMNYLGIKMMPLAVQAQTNSD